APALREGLVDALAVRADREPLGVAARHPDLAAQRDNRSPADRAVDDLVLQDIVGETLVVTVTGRQLRPGDGVLARALLGKDLGTHGDQCTFRGMLASSVERRVVGIRG